MTAIFAYISFAVSVIFAGVVSRQFLQRRRIYQAIWASALFLWALAALAEVLASIGGWTSAEFRLYYVAGGILLVGFFGLGSLYLLFPKVAKFFAWFMGLAFVLSVVATVGASIASRMLAGVHGVPPNTAMYGPRTHPGNVFNLLAYILAVVVNILGTIALAGGALYSVAMAAIRRSGWIRMISSLLILIGALVVASAASLTRFGQPGYFYLGQAIGIAIIFVGVLVAERPRTAAHREA